MKMDLRRKNIFYTIVLLLAMLIVYWVRQSNKTAGEMISFGGTTMGTIPYNVKYFDDQDRILKSQIDSLLRLFNQSLSTYIPDSEISTFNRDSLFQFKLPYFREVLVSSSKIFSDTEGAFDPTVMPLVNAWGFGPQKAEMPDSATVDSLKQFVGFNLVKFDEQSVWKSDPRVALDFSATAKGQASDVLVEFLNAQGIMHCFVEIGGEVRVSGNNLSREKPWAVAIVDPASTRNDIRYLATLEIAGGGIATSGNYFNYRVVNGRKYSHTLDPVSGYPVTHPLLSASVIAPTCMEADALATAFMVMGHEKAINYLNNHPEIQSFLVFSDVNGQMSTFATEGLPVKLLNE